MLFTRQSEETGKGWFRKDSGRRPWRLSAKLLIASSIATVIGFSAICISVMLDMRRGEEELARQTLENLAAGIDDLLDLLEAQNEFRNFLLLQIVPQQVVVVHPCLQ